MKYFKQIKRGTFSIVGTTPYSRKGGNEGNGDSGGNNEVNRGNGGNTGAEKPVSIWNWNWGAGKYDK